MIHALISRNNVVDKLSDMEKSTGVTEIHVGRSDRYESVAGDLQVLKISDSDDIKLAEDGKTVLIPQPSDDPEDPLRWPKMKNLVLLSLVFASLVSCILTTILTHARVILISATAYRLWNDLGERIIRRASSDVRDERHRRCQLHFWWSFSARSRRSPCRAVGAEIRSTSDPLLVSISRWVDGHGCCSVTELYILYRFSCATGPCKYSSASGGPECCARYVSLFYSFRRCFSRS